MSFFALVYGPEAEDIAYFTTLHAALQSLTPPSSHFGPYVVEYTRTETDKFTLSRKRWTKDAAGRVNESAHG